jgi:acetyltransferase-like isoleucine patch superfamily enzyme
MSGKLPWDWYDGEIPANAVLEEGSYLESSFSFTRFRSVRPCGLRMRHGSSAYGGTVFDLGPEASVEIGRYAMLNSVRIICDGALEIGDHVLLSWNVVLMDSYRAPLDPLERRRYLDELAAGRTPSAPIPAEPIRIGANVWIGFDSVILPGVSLGEGSIVGARSVVTRSVPPLTVVAGNPARAIRALDQPGSPHADAR